MNIMEKVSQISKKAGDVVSEACNNLAEKSEKYAEDCEMRCDVAAKDARLKELFQLIGEKVYARYSEEKTAPVDVLEELSLADQLVTELEGLNEKLLSHRGKKACKKCGSVIDVESVFCNVCGKKQVTAKDSK